MWMTASVGSWLDDRWDWIWENTWGHKGAWLVVVVTIGALILLINWRRRTPGWVTFTLASAAATLLMVECSGALLYAGVTLALVTTLSMASRQFAKTTMRVITVLALFAAALLLGHVGAETVATDADAVAHAALPADIVGKLCDRASPPLDGPGCLHAVRDQQVKDAEEVVNNAEEIAAAHLVTDLESVGRRIATTDGLEDIRDQIDGAKRIVHRTAGRASADQLDDVLDGATATLNEAIRLRSVSHARTVARAALDEAIDALDIDAAAEALATAKKAQKEDGTLPTEIVSTELITKGITTVLNAWGDAVLGPKEGPDDLRVVPGDVAWVLFAFVLVMTYRRLELRNNQTYGAPVQFPTLKATGQDLTADFLTEGIKVRYGSTDLLEPPDTPGGTAVESVQTTLSEAAGTKSKLVMALVQFAQATAFPSAGITVSGAVTFGEEDGKKNESGATPTTAGLSEGDPATDGETDKDTTESPKLLLGVFRLETTNEHRFIRTEQFETTTQAGLMDEVAALVASDVIAYSFWTPRWARSWGPRGSSLVTYRDLMRHRSQDADKRLEALQVALGNAPSNGFIRHMLAHELDLAGRPVEALRLNLQNRIDYPHYLAGRYRLVTSLSMLSDLSVLRNHWWSVSAAESRAEILRLVDAGDLLSTKPAAQPSTGSSNPWWFRVQQFPAWVRRLHLSEGARDFEFWKIKPTPAPSPPTKVLTELRSSPAMVNEQSVVSLALLDWARYEARRIRHTYRPWRLAALALPQEERKVFLGLLRSARRRRSELDQLRSIEAIIEARALLATAVKDAGKVDAPVTVPIETLHWLVEEVIKLTNENRVSSTALYNAACFWSIAAEMVGEAARTTGGARTWLDESLSALEASLRVGDGSRPDRSWLENDPDLTLVRDTSGWRQLMKRLDEETETTDG